MSGDSGTNFAKCSAAYMQDMSHYGEERWSILGATFAVMLAVTALFWVALWMAAQVIRWILAGRSV